MLSVVFEAIQLNLLSLLTNIVISTSTRKEYTYDSGSAPSFWPVCTFGYLHHCKLSLLAQQFSTARGVPRLLLTPMPGGALTMHAWEWFSCCISRQTSSARIRVLALTISLRLHQSCQTLQLPAVAVCACAQVAEQFPQDCHVMHRLPFLLLLCSMHTVQEVCIGGS